MPSLAIERRLAELERAAIPDPSAVRLVAVTFLSPGDSEDQPMEALSVDGEVWRRDPSEDEGAFKERIVAELDARNEAAGTSTGYTRVYLALVA